MVSRKKKKSKAGAERADTILLWFNPTPAQNHMAVCSLLPSVRERTRNKTELMSCNKNYLLRQKMKIEKQQ